MKISKPPFGTLPKVLLLSVLSGLSLIACTRRAENREELPSGRYVQPEVPVTPAQNKSLGEELESQLTDSLEPIFTSTLLSSDRSQKMSEQQWSRLSRAMSQSFAKEMAARAQRNISTNCVSNSEKTAAYVSCLVFEVIGDHLASVNAARRWISSFAQLKDSAGKNFYSETEAVDIAYASSEIIVSVFTNRNSVENMLVRLNRTVDGAVRALEILSARQVSLDMPYLSESFIEGRQFVLTTSLQQGSVGTSRVFNLDSMIVRLEINNNRLVILRSGDGLYAGSSQEDLIVGAYPVVRTVQPEGQSEDFYQIDFSKPENKNFLVSTFASGAALQLSADVVVPRIAHAAKPVLGPMTNGLYFTKQDANFVIDQLVLVNSDEAIFGEGDEDEQIKDPIRPTVHVVQGFFPVPEGEDSFEMKQALPVDLSQQELRARGVNDQTNGRDVPYFATPGIFESSGGRASKLVPYVRKFNREKEIVFVLSRNVPGPLVPVLKSAVLSFKEVFDSLANKDAPVPAISVYTQDEFEEANRTQGLALGGSVIAADPRVNMIFWDDSLNLGSAWATAAANPKTGEIISGDVMLSGSMWAMEGCKGYFQRTWQKDKEPNLPKRPSGSVPSPVSRFLWEAKCDAALSNLGIFKARGNPVAEPSNDNAKLAEFERANREGDLKTLARHASELLGRTVDANEMVSELSHARAGGKESAQSLADAYAKLSKDNGSLKKNIDKRVGQLHTMLGANESDSQMRTLASGRNVVRAKLDCVRSAMPNADIQLAEGGAPRIDSPYVTSAEQGALALVRSVVVHELGHIFGLRHNFIASTTPTVYADDAKLPLAIDSGTDSVMDYNDYGIEMTAGAMRDFSKAEGAVGLATFGIYDVLALATAYGLPTDTIKFKTPPAFCTDSNVGTFGNCQRFDFGKDYNEYMMHRINLILQRLRYANPMDAILDPRLPGIYAQQISTLTQELLKITALWGIAQSSAVETSEVAVLDALVRSAEFAYRGVGARQEFLKKFPAQYGTELIGTYAAMRLPASFFASPEYGALISSLIRREMDLNVIAVARVLQDRSRGRGSDSAYLGSIANVTSGGTVLPYLDDMLGHFGTRVILQKGAQTSFEYFFDGQRYDSSGATLDGKPFALTLEKPLFNHQAQISVVPNVVLDGPAPGSRKTVTALVKGRHSIDEMVRAIAALSVLAGENPIHPAVSELAQQAEVLQSMLQTDACAASPEDFATLSQCENLRAEARAPAAVILNMVMSAAQGALPATMVASGEER
ncbi:MAG: hypothetical protein RLZZ488_2045 [Pseudomonadota bacterium]